MKIEVQAGETRGADTLQMRYLVSWFENKVLGTRLSPRCLFVHLCIMFLPILSIYVSSVSICQTPLPPLTANVIICLTPPPPFVSQCQQSYILKYVLVLKILLKNILGCMIRPLKWPTVTVPPPPLIAIQ